ncbi:Zinc transporter ZIP4 [Platysternon megacephalum]|uniref:Ribosome biogenesis protein NOP53 n=1 Tax=Platysternon megacephalum TaxID=55544 RepID=A0A4D9DSW2_9SAUR|nr:Zinc transporter ZIP4 [Platysternon megacephalum]
MAAPTEARCGAAASAFLGFRAGSRDPGAPGKRRARGSRNRKKSWKRWRGPEAQLGRELGAFLEDVGLQQRAAGGLVAEKPDESLFFMDTGSEEKDRELNQGKEKPLRIDLILQPDSKVPAPKDVVGYWTVPERPWALARISTVPDRPPLRGAQHADTASRSPPGNRWLTMIQGLRARSLPSAGPVLVQRAQRPLPAVCRSCPRAKSSAPAPCRLPVLSSCKELSARSLPSAGPVLVQRAQRPLPAVCRSCPRAKSSAPAPCRLPVLSSCKELSARSLPSAGPVLVQRAQRPLPAVCRSCPRAKSSAPAPCRLPVLSSCKELSARSLPSAGPVLVQRAQRPLPAVCRSCPRAKSSAPAPCRLPVLSSCEELSARGVDATGRDPFASRMGLAQL